MSRNPCPPNCKCNKHKSKYKGLKCPPGCTCWRHHSSQKGIPKKKCPENCTCGKHTWHGKGLENLLHDPCPPNCNCHRHSEEHKQRTSAIWKGKTLSDEHKAKLGVSHKGKKMNLSQEERDRRRERINYYRQFSRMFNTKPERKLEECLIELGIEYKKQRRIGPHTVDFVIENHIIEMNGCYWHRCEQCGYEDDIGAHKKDEKKKLSALSLGFTHEVVWEHNLDKWINTMRTGERTATP